MEYLDFELRIGTGQGRAYPVEVVRSPAGEQRVTMVLPCDPSEVPSYSFASGRSRGSGAMRELARDEPIPASENAHRELGRLLFQSILPESLQACYRVSREKATREGKGLRIRLRMDDPQLAQLPWELLYDDAEPGFVGLSNRTPIVRYMELARGSAVPYSAGPLRVLCMISSPTDLPALDVAREREKVSQVLAAMNDKVEVTWIEGATARHLQNALLETDWHVFHFVGHGGFDADSAEGFLALENEQGTSHPLAAAQLATLLADEDTLRLVVLNSCEGARGSAQSRFSGIAATLTQRGIPAVVAMQKPISDRAAILFAREFYSAIADGMPVDAAVSEGRKAITLDDGESVEWATPVLYMRSPDGRLFQRTTQTTRVPNAPVAQRASDYDGRDDMPELPGTGKVARIVVPIAILVALAVYALFMLY